LTTTVTEKLESLAAELAKKHGVQTLAVPLDVTESASVAALAQAVKDRFGSVRVLVNNAGVALGTGKTLATCDEAAWIKTIDINLNGPFRVSRAIIPLMKKPAAIVNIASRAGKSPAPTIGAYSTSKAGLIMFTKQLALEMASEGIRVNAVCPGPIASDALRDRIRMESEASHTSLEVAERTLASKVPLGRFGTPADVANVVAAIASEEFSFVNAQAINICGGQLPEL
ncbi:MAG: SDR family NAD(P)-dependent oxidoreductase, partial [Gemmatimonas sp.]